MLNALIFDVDGTMADTERFGHRIAYNEAFRAFGLDWHWDENLYGKLLKVAGGKERMEFYAKTYFREFEPPCGLSLGQMIDAIHEAKTEIFIAIVGANAIPLRPGIGRIIEEARAQRLRLAIATSTMRSNVYALLKMEFGENSISWFDVIAGADTVPMKKPEPDIYRYVLEKMGLRANECLAFEDSTNGLISSLEAGIPTIVTLNDYTEDEDFSDAAVVVDHLGEPDNPIHVVKGEQIIGSPILLDISSLKKIHESQAS